MFQFKGELSASKSLYNRALTLKSFFPALNLIGSSQAKDVKYLQQALLDLQNGQTEFNLGEGGTSFRFFLLRCSRIPGNYTFRVSPRLFDRPSEEFVTIGQQLGFHFYKKSNAFFLETQGWKFVSSLKVPSHRSSQFISAVILNSWGLDFDLNIEKSDVASQSYFEMTHKMCGDLGLQIEDLKNHWRVPQGQQIQVSEYHVEPDMSSVFTLACCAAVGGDIELYNINAQSLQPDTQGLHYLSQMGVDIKWQGSVLRVKKTSAWQGVQLDIRMQPDLFPCLCALLALAQSPSQVTGTEVLKYKESDRLFHMVQCLRELGAEVNEIPNGLEIKPIRQKSKKSFIFQTYHDHRLAFAYQALKLAGFDITIAEPKVVEKSFPEFWSIFGGSI